MTFVVIFHLIIRVKESKKTFYFIWFWHQIMKTMDGLDDHGAESQNHDQYHWISCQPLKRGFPSTILLFFLILLLTSAFFCWTHLSTITSTVLFTSKWTNKDNLVRRQEFRLNCSREATAKSCATNHTSITTNSSGAACPEYFRWIHEDLRPWKTTGISRDMIEKTKEFAHFRLVIVDGEAYLEKFKNAFQTRDVFTIWGFLQLLRLYPGKVPDVELVFQCEDMPLVLKKDHKGPNATWPPITFQYCGREDALGVVFPDWSFWGWGELNIRPWENLVEDLKNGNKKMKWKSRKPYAYWKGNPGVSADRGDLMRCDSSKKHDWNARLYSQDWDREIKQGFKNSKLKDQCKYRYKIYIEGRGWSVSEKYILACDSMVLFVKPKYYDFYNRGLVPMEHFWPIRPNNKCRDIKFAVQWGNTHTREAKGIGEAGSKFIKESVKMEFVYDYMFHALSEYSKLLKFKPEIPKGAEKLCAERMACSKQGVWKKFMVESMVRVPSDTPPCTIPPPYEPQELKYVVESSNNISRQVEMWESEQWEKKHKKN